MSGFFVYICSMTIFLDIDGVLRTHKSDLEWSLQLGVPIPLSVYDRRFDRKIVSYINEVVGYTRAKIVITSTWRKFICIIRRRSIRRRSFSILQCRSSIPNYTRKSSIKIIID